jgi:hypothetical protein
MDDPSNEDRDVTEIARVRARARDPIDRRENAGEKEGRISA